MTRVSLALAAGLALAVTLLATIALVAVVHLDDAIAACPAAPPPATSTP